MHLNKVQFGDSSLILDHTELCSPTMLAAPSLPYPTQLLRVRPYSFNASLITAKRASPVAVTTGNKPMYAVWIFCLDLLKYVTQMQSCFWTAASVDSSTRMEKNAPSMSALSSSCRVGAMTWSMRREHFVR